MKTKAAALLIKVAPTKAKGVPFYRRRRVPLFPACFNFFRNYRKYIQKELL